MFVKILRTNHPSLPGNNTSSKTNILKKKALRISLILEKKKKNFSGYHIPISSV